MAKPKGTRDDPWVLKTPPGSSEYTIYRDDEADPPTLVSQVGSTRRRATAAGSACTCRRCWRCSVSRSSSTTRATTGCERSDRWGTARARSVPRPRGRRHPRPDREAVRRGASPFGCDRLRVGVRHASAHGHRRLELARVLHRNDDDDDWPEGWPFADLATIRGFWDEEHARLLAYATSLDEAAVNEVLTWQSEGVDQSAPHGRSSRTSSTTGRSTVRRSRTTSPRAGTRPATST
jgi:hypothetical protein